MRDEVKLGQWYEAKPCKIHTQNRGNCFQMDELRLKMFGTVEFEAMLKCGCLVKTHVEDITFPGRGPT